MSTSLSCSFLRLPQELRDSIYEHALDAETNCISPATDNTSCRGQAQCAGWTISFDQYCPTATYLSLMRCSRQLRQEVNAFLTQAGTPDGVVKLDLHTAYPNMSTEWTCISRRPTEIRDLFIRIKMQNLFDPALGTPQQHDVLLRPIFEILRRYIFRGPHFARQTNLRQPLHLRTVRIALSSAIPLEDLFWVYGSPAAQLEVLFGHFTHLVARIARSGLLSGAVEHLEISLEGKETERVPVQSNLWNEQDHVFFSDAGFRWDPC